uniref:K Homology domain-containing protein n=1 Tax=Glossina brevipalpis TaxID=37001 RepID=A0A1A9WNA8_9MUSC
MLDITRDRPVKVAVKVAVPVRDHPKFNFVGKLLGPKGNSMKRLQEETMCKMAVLGRGSMRDRKKEEEMRASGDSRYAHLFEDLHVEISTFAAPAEAHARIAYALAEVRRFLVPVSECKQIDYTTLITIKYYSWKQAAEVEIFVIALA